MDRDQFERLVAEALDDLPSEIQGYMENIAITITDWPSPAEINAVGQKSPYGLLGLYRGVPLTKRGRAYNMAMPDRIVIFQRPIEAVAHTPDAIRERIRQTVAHEIAHHFGLDDAALAHLGY
jgi:predicted Zn-dependent protease with MMP-like domain